MIRQPKYSEPVPTILPRRRWWRRSLARRFGANDGLRRLERIEVTYRDLLDDPPPGVAHSSTLTWHLRQSIGPLLAAYLVLREETGDAAGAQRHAQDLMTEQMTPILGIARIVDRLRLPYAALRRLTVAMLPRSFPAPGFAVRWRKNTRDTMAFDIHRCFYLATLRHYGAPELTRIFCFGDTVFFNELGAVEFSRAGTLAEGRPLCDFRLERRPR